MALQAGSGLRDISPKQPMALYGYPHVERFSTGVHDPLLASVLVLRNGGETLVLASLDILMLDPAFAHDLRHDVAQAVGCREEGVFIGCTHTHSGPVTSCLLGWRNDVGMPPIAPDYLLFLKSQVVAAAVAAAYAPEPAEAVWTRADATGVGGNRRSQGGLTDPECGILAVRRSGSAGELLGLLLVYGMHPTVLHEDSTLVSADFPFYTRQQIQEHVGSVFPIVYHNAPSGNQSPRHFVEGQTFAEAERLGRRLGEVVCGALDAIDADAWSGSIALQGRLAQVALKRNPVRSLPDAERLLAEVRERYERLRRENAPRAEIRTAECAVFGAEGARVLAQAAASGELETALQDYRKVDLQAVRIGDASLVGFPGETFTEYALELKRRAAGTVYPVSLVNGNLQGYIVTPEAGAEGGYEATNAVFAPESGKIMVEAALSLVSKECNERAWK